MRIVWAILSVILCLAFIGFLVRLIVGFGALVLSAKILWLALLVILAAAIILLVRKAIRTVS